MLIIAQTTDLADLNVTHLTGPIIMMVRSCSILRSPSEMMLTALLHRCPLPYSLLSQSNQ